MHGAGQIFRVVARRQKTPQLFDRRHDDDSVALCVLLGRIANTPKRGIDSAIVKHTIEVAARTTSLSVKTRSASRGVPLGN